MKQRNQKPQPMLDSFFKYATLSDKSFWAYMFRWIYNWSYPQKTQNKQLQINFGTGSSDKYVINNKNYHRHVQEHKETDF